MKFVIVSLCCATLAERVMKGLRREDRGTNDWIYRRLWNDTVSDCWSLRSAAWNVADRSSLSAPSAQNRGGLGHTRGWEPTLRGRFAVWGAGKYAFQPANPSKSNRSRSGKGCRQGQSRNALAQPRIVHIRATTGLLGWLYPLLGQGKRLNG